MFTPSSQGRGSLFFAVAATSLLWAGCGTQPPADVAQKQNDAPVVSPSTETDNPVENKQLDPPSFPKPEKTVENKQPVPPSSTKTDNPVESKQPVSPPSPKTDKLVENKQPTPPSPPPTETEWYPTENAIRGSGPQAATAVLLVGLAIVVFTAVFAVNRVDEYLDHPPRMSAPGSTVLNLASGTYVIFEHPSSPRVPSSCPSSQCATFGPSDVAVVGTSGARPVISADLSADRLTEKGLTYRGIVEFHIGESGNYRIVVRASAPGQLLIDPSPGQEVHAFAGWIARGATGLIAIVIGVGLIVRARWRRRLPATWRIANS